MQEMVKFTYLCAECAKLDDESPAGYAVVKHKGLMNHADASPRSLLPFSFIAPGDLQRSRMAWHATYADGTDAQVSSNGRL